MGNKLHIVVHTINGVVANTYDSWHEELVMNKLPKDIIHKSEQEIIAVINKLIHYGSFKTHIGNTKHCFYYNAFNTI